MKRRNFLKAGTAGLTGLALPNILARAATPCPVPSLQVDSSTPVTTSCAAASGTLLKITSAAGGTMLPFSFGQPFRQGDVPAGQNISSNVSTFQADVRNRWPDGSVKFAVLSGRQTLVANSPFTVSFQASGSSAGGSNIAEPTPAYLGANVAVVLTGAGAGTYTPQQAATNGTGTWDRTMPRKIREFTGPVMSEFHYYTPTSDAHLTIWWYVRVYSDRMEVETAVEQGWTKVAGAQQKSYSAVVRIAGTPTYSATIEHRHHARWSRRDWIGTDPQITPAHDRAYLAATKLVPNYAAISVSSGVLGGFAQSVAPMTKGNFDQDGTGTGAHDWLGLLPAWEAAYVITGDVRAFRSMLANEQAGNCCGVNGGPGGPGFGFVQRDEATGLPAAPTDYQTESYYGGGAGHLVAGSDSTTRPWWTDQAHSWAAGYLAYLTTGRWFSLESCQHLCASEFLVTSNYDNNAVRIAGGHVQDRAAAWMWRTAACALAITPDSGSSLRAKYISYLQANIATWRSAEVGLNNLGLRQNPYNHTDYGPSGYLSAGMFQQYFLTQTIAFARDIAGNMLSSSAQTQLLESAMFHCSMPVGLLGTRPGGFCYKAAAAYGYVVGPTTSSFYANFGAWYDGCVAAGQITSDTCSTGGGLGGGNFPDATSYWGNFLPSIAYAVDLGVTGASAAYARLTGASNWSSFYSNLPNAPQWAILPR